MGCNCPYRQIDSFEHRKAIVFASLEGRERERERDQTPFSCINYIDDTISKDKLSNAGELCSGIANGRVFNLELYPQTDLTIGPVLVYWKEIFMKQSVDKCK